MNALTPLAVQNLDLLRLLARGEIETKAAAAAFLGRDEGNFSKTVKRLTEEGLIDWPNLTDAGQRVVDAADMAEGKARANPVRDELVAKLRAAGATIVAGDIVTDAPPTYVHADLTPNPDQPRKDFDPEQLGELAATILADGQLQNILARPNPHQPGPALQIVGGERRWRAIGLLIEDDKLPADHPVKVEVRDLTDAQVDSLALVENMQRANLSPLEEARAFQRLRKVHGWSNADIAGKINKDPRVVQLRLNLLEMNGGLDEAEQAQLESGELTITEALRRLRNRPAPLDLDDRQRLVLAELFQSAGRESPIGKAHYWDSVECDGAAAKAAIEAFALEDLLQVTGPLESSGRFKIQLKNPAWEPWSRIIKVCPEIEDADSRKTLLLALRARLFGADEAEARDTDGQLSVVWLNGPFDLTEEGQAIADAYAARMAQINEDNQRAAQEREARDLARRHQLNQARARTDAVTDRFQAAPTLATAKADEEVSSALDLAGHPLPWSYRYKPGVWYAGDIIDANGAKIDFNYGDDAVLDIVKRLVMASVNAAAGLTPVIEVVPDETANALADSNPTTDPNDEDYDGDLEPQGAAEFWTWVGARLTNLHGVAADRAPTLAALAEARLDEEGETFGDESRAWTLADAVEIADGYAEDFPEALTGAAPPSDDLETRIAVAVQASGLPEHVVRKSFEEAAP